MRQFVNSAGLVLVGAAAAILTFNTLRALAESCGFTGWQGWLLPVAVDAAGAVATNVWLTGKDSPDAVRFARTWALTAAGVSLLGNATQHGLAAYGLPVPWWAVVLVAVVPPLAFVGTIHLLVLLSRTSPGHVQTNVRAGAGRARTVAAKTATASSVAGDELAAPKAEPVKPETTPAPSAKRKPSEPAKRAQAVAEQHISEVGKLPSVRELERKAGVSRNLSQRTLTALRVTPAVEEVRRNGSPVSV